MRGYNQSEIIAGMLAERLGVPLMRPLRRRRWTAMQARLDHGRRRTNMTGAFAVSGDGEKVHGKRILLVDDVFTTGATLTAAAKEIIGAGAAEVSVLCAARA